MHSPVLALRPYDEADQDAMIELLTDERVREGFILPDFNTRDEAAAMFGRLLKYSRGEDHFERGVFVHGRLIGFVCDVRIEGDTIELGYVIHPNEQGKGYATRALGEAIRTLFAQGFNRVVACAFVDNAASFRVMEKCGMTKTGMETDICYRGKTRVCRYYAISAP